MNCCDYDCTQGRDCPERTTRRVRAGQPVPDLPLQFTQEQEAAWEKDDRDLRRAVAGVLIVFGLIACLVLWGVQ